MEFTPEINSTTTPSPSAPPAPDPLDTQTQRLEKLVSTQLELLAKVDPQKMLEQAVKLIKSHDEDSAIALLKKIPESYLKKPVEDYYLLHYAAGNDAPRIAHMLLDNGEDPNLPSRNHQTPLHVAAHCGCPEMITLLHGRGANLNTKRETFVFDRTPLQTAAENGNLKCVKTLVELGADATLKTYEWKKGWKTAATCARESDHYDVWKYLSRLQQQKATKTTEPAPAKEQLKKPDSLKSRIQRLEKLVTAETNLFASVDPKKLVEHTVEVIMKKDEETALALLKKLPDDYLKQDIDGYSLLHYAAACDLTSVVQTLLDRGIDPNREGKVRSTPLHQAAFNGRDTSIRILHKAGANLNAKEGKQLAEYILLNPAPEFTPLQLAARAGHRSTVELLVELGADPTLRTHHYGRMGTAAQLAAGAGHYDIEKYLRKVSGC